MLARRLYTVATVDAGWQRRADLHAEGSEGRAGAGRGQADDSGRHADAPLGGVPEGMAGLEQSALDHRQHVQSVRRACAVIRALATGPAPCSTEVLAARLDLDRTVVRRLLATLELDGLVSRCKKRWQLGPAAVAFGNAYLDAHPLYQSALRHAVILHDDVARHRPWAVNAAVPIGAEAILIARFLGPSAPVDAVLKAGTRLPITGSALGRSMLAFLDPQAQELIVGREEAERFANRGRLIRSQGGVDIAVDEIRPGISAIAAAVFDEARHAIAALGISGPSGLLPVSLDSDLVGRLRRTAARVADEHGATSPQWWLGLMSSDVASVS